MQKLVVERMFCDECVLNFTEDFYKRTSFAIDLHKQMMKVTMYILMLNFAVHFHSQTHILSPFCKMILNYLTTQ